MHNGTQCLSMYRHHSSQVIPAFAMKACVLATKSRMLNFCDACAAICGNCNLRELIMQVTKTFSVCQKKQRSKQINITMTFGKSLLLTQNQYAIYISPNTKDLVINLTMIAFGNRKNSITFARPNNSDLLRALKHLIETRPYLSRCTNLINLLKILQHRSLVRGNIHQLMHP